MMSEKLSVFVITNNINTKGDLLTDDQMKEYVPFMINKVLSNTQDSLFLANELNRYYSLPTKLQYHFLYYGLPKRKRFGKWNKNADPMDNIKLIQEYYGYSYAKAKEVLPLILPQIDKLKDILYKGGKK